MSRCTSCHRNDCICQVPYFAEGCELAENHTQEIVTGEFAYGLKIPVAWNIPACGVAAVLSTFNATDIPVGSELWHKQYGRFQVQAFDYERQLLTVVNNCLAENKDPGTEIPKCTTFLVTPPDASSSATGGTFLDADFIAPAIDACADMLLTNLVQFVVGDGLQIENATYRISAINTGTNTVAVCNDGNGLTPGTVLRAQNVAGENQYPVYPISIDACAKDLNTEGTVQACVEGVQTGITGSVNGSLLTLTDYTTGVAAYSNTVPTDLATIKSNFGGSYPAPCSDYENIADAYATIVTSLNNTEISDSNPGPYTSDVATLAIGNSSTCRDMDVLLTADVTVRGEYFGTSLGYMQFSLKIQFSNDNFSTFTSSETYHTFYSGNAIDFGIRSDIAVSNTVADGIAANSSKNFQCRAILEYTALGGPLYTTIASPGVGIVLNALAVAV